MGIDQFCAVGNSGCSCSRVRTKSLRIPGCCLHMRIASQQPKFLHIVTFFEFLYFFLIISPLKLFAYPLKVTREPSVVRVPQFENRWSKVFITQRFGDSIYSRLQVRVCRKNDSFYLFIFIFININCPSNDKPSPEDGSRFNSRNVV